MRIVKKLYEQIFYSEYGIVLTTISTLILLVLSLFVFEENVASFIQTSKLVNIPYVLDFASIVVTVLIVNICLKSIKTTNRLRMIVYSIFFTLGGGLMFIEFTNLNWFSVGNSYDFYMFIASLGKFLIGFGILLAAIIKKDAKVSGNAKIISTVIIYIIWGLLLVSALHFRTFGMDFDLTAFNVQSLTLVEYATAITFIIALGIHYRNYSLEKNKHLLLFMTGLMILLIAQVIRLTFIRYTYLYNSMYTLYVLVGYVIVYNTLFAYNIISPISELINDEKQIKLYADNLEVIVERRTTEMQNNNMRLIQEIDYAKNIQQSLLPPKKVNFNKVVFASEYFPCERLSGDFFDIYRLDDTNIGMYVLDVSGHGVSAALMTMFCNNYIRSSEKLIMKYRGLKPHRNLKHFYEEFNKMKFPDEMYMVMFFASYNIETGSLTYSSGGMNCYPLVMRKDGTKEYLDKSQGFPICKMSSFFTPTYTSESIILGKGDRVIFYTDGLTDNKKNKTISQDQLEDVMYRYRNLNLKSLTNKIKSYIEYEDGTSEDDITYFVMEI